MGRTSTVKANYKPCAWMHLLTKRLTAKYAVSKMFYPRINRIEMMVRLTLASLLHCHNSL